MSSELLQTGFKLFEDHWMSLLFVCPEDKK